MLFLHQKKEAASTCAEFTKKYPVYFTDASITRKMHLLGFFIQKLIEEDQSENICYKFLKVEQAMERIHHIWKVLEKTRFYSVRTEREKLL